MPNKLSLISEHTYLLYRQRGFSRVAFNGAVEVDLSKHADYTPGRTSFKAKVRQGVKALKK
jgi:hypothetical protein